MNGGAKPIPSAHSGQASSRVKRYSAAKSFGPAQDEFIWRFHDCLLKYECTGRADHERIKAKMDISDMDSCLRDDSCPTLVRQEDESQTGRANPKQLRLSQAEFSPYACSNVPAVPLYRIYHANSEIGYQPVTK